MLRFKTRLLALALAACLVPFAAEQPSARAPLVDITSPLGRMATAGAVRIVAQIRGADDAETAAHVQRCAFS